MRLKNQAQRSVPSLFDRGEHDADLRWVVSVVVEHEDALCLTLPLEAPGHPAETRHSGLNIGMAHIERACYDHRRQNVQHIVRTGQNGAVLPALAAMVNDEAHPISPALD